MANDVLTPGGGKRKSTGYRRALPKPTLNLNDPARSVNQQLKDFLCANHARIIDVVRLWDVDGSGTISNDEFRSSLAKMGVKKHQDVVDDLVSAEQSTWRPAQASCPKL